MAKLKQKISGGFRSDAIAISTAKKQGWNIIPALMEIPETLIGLRRLIGPDLPGQLQYLVNFHKENFVDDRRRIEKDGHRIGYSARRLSERSMPFFVAMS